MLRNIKIVSLAFLTIGVVSILHYQVNAPRLTGQEGYDPPMCGNGKVEEYEECDDGNMEEGDGCNSSCEEECGFCWVGYGNCEPDACNNANGERRSGAYDFDDLQQCIDDCPLYQCGDGQVQKDNPSISEECDDPRCLDGTSCGGIGATCDDGSQCKNRQEYGCGELCEKYCFSCGGPAMDGGCEPVTPLNGECDPENNMFDSPDACAQECGPVCGDGTVDAGEECDGGDGCESDCTCTLGKSPDGGCKECDFGSPGNGKSQCDDNNVCTQDICGQNSGKCSNFENVGCSDGNACTEDRCDPIDGCVYEPDGDADVYCGMDGEDPICCEDECSEECYCGPSKEFCGQDEDNELVCCASGKCEQDFDDECVDACDEARQDDEDECAKIPDIDPNDGNDASDQEYLDCLQAAQEAWETCIDGCKEEDSWHCAGSPRSSSGPPNYSYNPPKRPVIGIIITPSDEGGGGGGSTGGPPPEKKCSYGSFCRNNQCVYVAACSTVSDPPEMEMECNTNNGCGGGGSSSAGSSSSQKDFMCCDGSCIEIGTDFDGVCASPAYSEDACNAACGGGDTHTACIDDTCTEVAGPGEDGCRADADCASETHGVCHGTTCAQEPGAGEDLCDANADCTNAMHLECVDDQCVAVNGPGKNRCDAVLGCGSQQSGHTRCENNACLSFPGPGDNECSTDIPCGQHTVCQNSACTLVDGEGENECENNTECSGTASSNSSSFTLAQSSSEGTSSASRISSSFVIALSSSISSSESQLSEESSSDDVASSDGSSSQVLIAQVSSSSENVVSSSSESSDDNAADGSSSSLLVITQQEYHAECRGEQCVQVEGAGSDDCSSDEDCIQGTPVIANRPCGNNLVNPGEECDDGNTDNGDGCNASCVLENADPVECSFGTDCVSGNCGNGICLCSSDAQCGAGSCTGGVCATEEGSSQTGGATGTQVARADEDDIDIRLVAAAAVCGNGILDEREECDDRNRRDEDGCSSTCLLEIGICGDGAVQSLLGEQCEFSTHNPSLPYACKNCRFFSTSCGDGNIDLGEECDDGIQNSHSPDANCRPDCSAPRCGDGIIDSAEQCDDGNRLGGDNCDRYCRVEDGEPGVSVIASDQQKSTGVIAGVTTSSVAAQPSYQQFTFPQYANFQQLPYQLPLAQLQPLIQTQGPAGDTGPAAVVVIGAGAAAGLSWMRRKRK